MNILGSVVGPLVKTVLDKVLGQIPMSETERQNVQFEADQELKKNAGTVAEAEARIAEASKDVWLAELHNGGFLATSWRPLLALVCMAILVWEAIILSILNIWVHVPYAPEYVSSTAMWCLLTLIGARGLEKINITRTRG